MGFKAQAEASDLSKYFFHETLVTSGLQSQKKVSGRRSGRRRRDLLGEIEPMEVSLTRLTVFEAVVRVMSISRETSLMHERSLFMCPHLHSPIRHGIAPVVHKS